MPATSRTVMSRARVSDGSYFATGSSNDSRPSCASCSATAHVNCLVTDPIAKSVSVATGVRSATRARP
ncbi:MAG: hypothetical protein R2708_19640 [Vicinamibacterales bacterium]